MSSGLPLVPSPSLSHRRRVMTAAASRNTLAVASVVPSDSSSESMTLGEFLIASLLGMAAVIASSNGYAGFVVGTAIAKQEEEEEQERLRLAAEAAKASAAAAKESSSKSPNTSVAAKLSFPEFLRKRFSSSTGTNGGGSSGYSAASVSSHSLSNRHHVVGVPRNLDEGGELAMKTENHHRRLVQQTAQAFPMLVLSAPKEVERSEKVASEQNQVSAIPEPLYDVSAK
jgi:hypothetical protein